MAERETLRQSFELLAEKFDSIKAGDSEAKVCLAEYGARAGRLLRQAGETRLLPEDLLPAKWTWPEGQSVLDEMSPDRWFLAWRAFIVSLPLQYPERFPGLLGSRLARRTKLTAVGKPLPPQQRASDYADVCRFLAKLVGPSADSPADDNDWILVSEAVARLPFVKNTKALYAFAQKNPAKLRLRHHPTHRQRRQANAADVLRLEMEHDTADFEAMDSPAADNLPPVSEQGVAALTERVAAVRAKKAGGK